MPAEERAAKVMKEVVVSLCDKRPQEAVRRFVDGMDHGIAPASGDLSRWLVKTVGTQAAVMLIKALARYPCFYCKKGLEWCEACKDRQRASWQKVACERCLDFGVARCDFCDGTGWVTYNFIPGGLWIAVMVERTEVAIKEIDALLRKKVPMPTQTNSEAIEKDILAANRLAGVLENALIAAKTRLAMDPATEKHAGRVIQKCLKAWPRLQTRTYELLKALAQVLRIQATQAPTSSARELLLERAKFYDMLSRSRGFPGTGLEHPFLVESRKAQ